MEWNELYGLGQEPEMEDIRDFLGNAAPLWNELQRYIEDTYHVPSKMAYSKCSAQPGWNMKYQKGGKSLCTLYPMQGFFIALIVIGTKEEAEVGAAMTRGHFTDDLYDLYQRTTFSCGGRWLMINVMNRDVLEDVKRLISIRVKPKG